MKVKLFEFIKTEHQLLKQWLYGISDLQLHPIAKRINPPKGNCKKVVIVYPTFLAKHGIMRTETDALVFILESRNFVTMFYCDHPNYLYKKEAGAEFQTIY